MRTFESVCSVKIPYLTFSSWLWGGSNKFGYCVKVTWSKSLIYRCSPFFSAPYDQSLSLRSSLSSWSLSDLLMLLLLASLFRIIINNLVTHTHTHIWDKLLMIQSFLLHWLTCGWRCGCCFVPCRDISPSAGRSEKLLSVFCSSDTRTLCSSTDCTPAQICPLLADPQSL